MAAIINNSCVTELSEGTILFRGKPQREILGNGKFFTLDSAYAHRYVTGGEGRILARFRVLAPFRLLNMSMNQTWAALDATATTTPGPLRKSLENYLNRTVWERH